MKITKKYLRSLIEKVIHEMEFSEHDDLDCNNFKEEGFKSKEECCRTQADHGSSCDDIKKKPTKKLQKLNESIVPDKIQNILKPLGPEKEKIATKLIEDFGKQMAQLGSDGLAEQLLRTIANLEPKKLEKFLKQIQIKYKKSQHYQFYIHPGYETKDGYRIKDGEMVAE